MVLLLTAAICAPTLTAFNAALDRPWSLRRDLGLVLASLGLGSTALVALAPVLLLAVCFQASYHEIIMLTVGCGAVAGGLALALLVQGMRSTERRGFASPAVALCIVFALVGSQMAWTLRPYVVRPRTPDIPFVRSVEGSFLGSVGASFDSARGIYYRDAAPSPKGRGGSR
jgi:hypothetical protein